MNISRELVRIAHLIENKNFKKASRKVPARTTRAYTTALLEDAENGTLDWETIARSSLEYMSEDSVKDMAQSDFDYEDEEDEEPTGKDVNDHILNIGDTVKFSNMSDHYDEENPNPDTFEITEIEPEKYGTYLTLEKIPSREIEVVNEYEVEFVE